jgi:hypothetical protein
MDQYKNPVSRITETLEKMQAEATKSSLPAGAVRASASGGQCQVRQSIAEQKQYEANRCFDQGQKALEASAFLSQHPEFERFIELVRSGSIQL